MSPGNSPPDDFEADAAPAEAEGTSAEVEPSSEVSQSDQVNRVESVISKPTESEVDPMVAPSRAIRPHGLDEGRRLAVAAARVALDNKGSEVTVIDVSQQSAEFDFFVLANGTSRRQLHAISEQIDDALEKDLGDQRLGIEGYQESRWIVLDYGSVVIHLFDEETRDYYDLESLWADGQIIPLAELGLE